MDDPAFLVSSKLEAHAHSAVTRASLGGVGGDVLREVTCDVLVVSPRREGSRSS